MTYRRVLEGAYDIETQSVVNTTADEAIKGFHSTLTSKEAQEPNLIERKASVLLVAANSLSNDPEEGDKVISGGVTYEVLRIATHQYKESAAVWRLIIAKI